MRRVTTAFTVYTGSLLTVRDVLAAGMRLEPTGRNRRHYTVGFDDLEDGVRRLASCPHQVHAELLPQRVTWIAEEPGMNSRIDLIADLNDEDDDGLGWSTLSEASDPARIRPGAMLVAGNRQAQAVVRVVAVDDDGQVHFTGLPGSVRRTATSSAAPWPDRPAACSPGSSLPDHQGRSSPGNRQANRTCRTPPDLGRQHLPRILAVRILPDPAASAGDRGSGPVQTTAGFWYDRSWLMRVIPSAGGECRHLASCPV